MTTCLERTHLDYIRLGIHEGEVLNWHVLLAKHLLKVKELEINSAFVSSAKPGLTVNLLSLFAQRPLQRLSIQGWFDLRPQSGQKTIKEMLPDITEFKFTGDVDTPPPAHLAELMKQYLAELPTKLTYLKIHSDWFNVEVDAFPKTITSLSLSYVLKDTPEVSTWMKNLLDSVPQLHYLKVYLNSDWPSELVERDVELEVVHPSLSSLTLLCSEVYMNEFTIDLVHWKISAPTLDSFKLRSWYGHGSIKLNAPKLLTAELALNAVPAVGEHAFINNEDCPSLTQLTLIDFKMRAKPRPVEWIEDLPKSLKHLLWEPSTRALPLTNWIQVLDLPLESLELDPGETHASQIVEGVKGLNNIPSSLTSLHLAHGHLSPDAIEFLPTTLTKFCAVPTDPLATDQASERSTPKWNDDHLLQILQRLPRARIGLDMGELYGSCRPLALYWTKSPPKDTTELKLSEFMAGHFSLADRQRLYLPVRWHLDESFNFPSTCSSFLLHGAYDVQDPSYHPSFRILSLSFLTKPIFEPMMQTLCTFKIVDVSHLRHYIKQLAYFSGFSALKSLDVSIQSNSASRTKMDLDLFPSSFTELIAPQLVLGLSSKVVSWPTKLKRLSCQIRDWQDTEALHIVDCILNNQETPVNLGQIRKDYIDAIAAQTQGPLLPEQLDSSRLPSLPALDTVPEINLEGRVVITGALWPENVHAFRGDIAAAVTSAVLLPARLYGFTMGDLSKWHISTAMNSLDFVLPQNIPRYGIEGVRSPIGPAFSPYLHEAFIESRSFRKASLPAVLRNTEEGVQLPELDKLRELTITNTPVAPHTMRYPQNLTTLTLATRLKLKSDFFRDLPRTLLHLSLTNSRVTHIDDQLFQFIPASLITLNAPRVCIMRPEDVAELPITLTSLSLCALEWDESTLPSFYTDMPPVIADLDVKIHGFRFSGGLYNKFLTRNDMKHVNATEESIIKGSIEEAAELTKSLPASGVRIEFLSPLLAPLELSEDVESLVIADKAFMPSQRGLHMWEDLFPGIYDILNNNTPIHLATLHLQLMRAYSINEIFPDSLTSLSIECLSFKEIDWPMLPKNLKALELQTLEGNHMRVDDWNGLPKTLTSLVMPAIVSPPADAIPPSLTNIICLPHGTRAPEWRELANEWDDEDDDWGEDNSDRDSDGHASYHDHQMPDDSYHLGPDAGYDSENNEELFDDDYYSEQLNSDESNSDEENAMDSDDEDEDEDDQDLGAEDEDEDDEGGDDLAAQLALSDEEGEEDGEGTDDEEEDPELIAALGNLLNRRRRL